MTVLVFVISLLLVPVAVWCWGYIDKKTRKNNRWVYYLLQLLAVAWGAKIAFEDPWRAFWLGLAAAVGGTLLGFSKRIYDHWNFKRRSQRQYTYYLMNYQVPDSEYMAEYAKNDVELTASLLQAFNTGTYRVDEEWCSIYGHVIPTHHRCEVGVCYNPHRDGQELQGTQLERMVKAAKLRRQLEEENKKPRHKEIEE